jgi:hypothetical protein
MTREELEQEIRARIGGNYEAEEFAGTWCMHCGQTLDDPYFHEVPEHGSDEVHRVPYCEKSCKDAEIQEMFERDV